MPRAHNNDQRATITNQKHIKELKGILKISY